MTAIVVCGAAGRMGRLLMQLVLEALFELGPQAFITTHFLEFAAALARGTRQHRFLQAELDEHERPTFLFKDGVAKTSLAHRVAERLGVTRDSLRALMLQNNPELWAAHTLLGAHWSSLGRAQKDAQKEMPSAKRALACPWPDSNRVGQSLVTHSDAGKALPVLTNDRS